MSWLLAALIFVTDFSGPGGWLFYSDGAATASYQGVARIQVTQPGTNVQLFRTEVSLTEGTEYILTYRARASRVVAITTRLHLDAAPFTMAGLNQPVVLNPEWEEFQHAFPASLTTNQARLVFWLSAFDQAGDWYEFDDVKLETREEMAARRERPPANPGRTGTVQNPGRTPDGKWCWDPVAHDPPVTHYRIYASLDPEFGQERLVYEVPADVCQDGVCCGPLDRLPVVFFQVRAVNSAGEGP